MAGRETYRFHRKGDLYDWQRVPKTRLGAVWAPLNEILGVFMTIHMPGAVLLRTVDEFYVKLLTGWDDFEYCTIESDPPQYLVGPDRAP